MAQISDARRRANNKYRKKIEQWNTTLLKKDFKRVEAVREKTGLSRAMFLKAICEQIEETLREQGK